MNDFFNQQELAKRNTALLVLMFVCAVILIVLAVYLAVTVGLYLIQMFMTQQTGWFIRDFWDVDRFLWVTGVTAIIVSSGSLYRTHQLKQGGGVAVAEMLAAERIPSNTNDPLLSRLLNIVEEMAIASGLPVPPVYLMQESGINAFAAGFDSRDAVITVTNGAVELLNRDELQGVIAHEFSHILNGDTNLKMHLMGLLFGITLISDAGILLMTGKTGSRYQSRERGTHPAVIMFGFLIFMIGTIGAVFADLIKRAVSRQREYLADAAAVQFTRNSEGIASALKVIGGYKQGSRIDHAAGQQANHFFFSNTLKAWENKNWWATHPPLFERIQRLEPGFENVFIPVDSVRRSLSVINEAVGVGESFIAERVIANTDTLMASIGKPGVHELEQARGILRRIPKRLSDFSHDPFTARAAMYGLLLDRSSSCVRTIQLDQLQKHADASVFRELLDIYPVVARLDAELRLPLLEMLLPSLKSLSHHQFHVFRSCIAVLIRADKKLGLFEYMLQRMLLRHLYPTFLKVKAVSVTFNVAEQLKHDVAEIIVLLINKGRHEKPAKTFELAMSVFCEGDALEMPILLGDQVMILDEALKKGERASPKIKRRLLKACLMTVLADGNAAIEEIELIRAIADALDVPMPQVKIV